MKNDAFAGFHPLVNMLYFTVVIGFSMFFMHPVFLAVSLLCAAVYAVCLNGKKALRAALVFMLPMLLFTALLNPLFNHRGATILAYLPNGNPLTLESAVFGAAAAVMLVSVVTWFACFNAVMTSDKFVYLFGRVIPALSLVLALSLRLVPRYIAQIKTISNGQKGLGQVNASGKLPHKVKHALRTLSIMTTWALENAIETADSMKARGYGLPGRTAFSVFRFEKRDMAAIAYIAACAAIVLTGAALGTYHFRYFPTIGGQWRGGAVPLFAVYFALGAFPMMLNVKAALVPLQP